MTKNETFKKFIKKNESRFFPLLTTLILIIGFIILWQFQLRQEMNYEEELVEAEAERVDLEIGETIRQTSLALQRYTSRVEYLGTKDKAFLDLDSHAYLEQLPILKRIGLIDIKNRVYWAYPHEIDREVNGFDQGLNPVRAEGLAEAKMSHRPSLSRSVELRSGGLGFLLMVPLYPKEKFGGFVYATIAADNLFHSFVQIANFQVVIREDGRVIYSTDHQSSLNYKLTQSRIIQVGKSKWILDVTPTERFVSNSTSPLSSLILVFGIILSLLLGAYLRSIANSRKLALAAAENARLLNLRLGIALDAAKITNERLKRVIEATGEGIWERDYIPGGQIRFMDAQAKKIFGFQADVEPKISDIMKFVVMEDRLPLSKLVATHVENKTASFDIEFKMHDQVDPSKHRWIHARGRVLYDLGPIPQLVSTVKDVTVEVERREQLKRALAIAEEATRAKSDFLANMSHEIRTPLNGVIGMTGLLLDTHLDSNQRDYAETVRSSAEILLSLINDILDFSKIEARKLDLESIDFEIDEVTKNIERLLNFSAEKKGLKLFHTIASDLPTRIFKGDPNRIGQILANLLSNAIKFTERGHVDIKISQDKESVEPSSDHMTLRIEVTDTGIGMSPAALARMFQPFNQADASTSRRFGGTGLGLSICKHLVEMMGGQIGVRSTEGVGSIFWFTLVLKKLDTKVSTEIKSKAVQIDASIQKIRILLAEDNKVNQLIAIKMLERGGFRIDAVANGKEAVDAAKSIPYNLILMDCQMPELDGYEATKQIREGIAPHIPIIAMTANAMAGDREKCIAAGMNDYVVKPIRAQDLIEAINRVMSTSRAA